MRKKGSLSLYALNETWREKSRWNCWHIDIRVFFPPIPEIRSRAISLPDGIISVILDMQTPIEWFVCGLPSMPFKSCANCDSWTLRNWPYGITPWQFFLEIFFWTAWNCYVETAKVLVTFIIDHSQSDFDYKLLSLMASTFTQRPDGVFCCSQSVWPDGQESQQPYGDHIYELFTARGVEGGGNI